METIAIGGALLLLVLALGPSIRSQSGLLGRMGDPQYRETPARQKQANNDLALLIALFVIASVALIAISVMG